MENRTKSMIIMMEIAASMSLPVNRLIVTDCNNTARANNSLPLLPPFSMFAWVIFLLKEIQKAGTKLPHSVTLIYHLPPSTSANNKLDFKSLSRAFYATPFITIFHFLSLVLSESLKHHPCF